MAPPRHNQHNHYHHGNSTSANEIGGGITSSNSMGSTNSANGHDDPNSDGLPPAPSRVDAHQAQTYRLQDAYWSDDDEDMECPLCLEEIDISDANFKPCPCGYQICRFCWHHIKSNLNGRCPACRRKYTDNSVEFKPMSQEEIKKLSQAKKQRERERRDLEQMNRKHLANMRVVQKNLVYVVGMDPKLAREELIPVLRSSEYFGQYGRISKILISKRTTASKLIMGTSEQSIGIYVTYVRKEDAARAIIAIDGSKGADGKLVRASYGTTKYCTTYLRNLPCTNPICTYLHEPGEEADSFTKEDLTTLRHAAKDTEQRIRPGGHGQATSRNSQDRIAAQIALAAEQSSMQSTTSAATNQASINDNSEVSALPKTVSWASSKGPVPSQKLQSATSIRESDLPPLSAIANTSRKSSSQKVPITAKNKNTHAAAASATAISGRSQSPALSRSSNASPVASPAPPPPPGLIRSETPQGKEESEEENLAQPITNLSRIIANSRSATPSAETNSSGSEAKTSNYRLSSNAQAVLNDMRARREAEAHQPAKNLFQDFDATLRNFSDGTDFCFTLQESLIPEYLRGSTSELSTHSFASNPTAIKSTQQSFALPRPESLRTYSGRFDPFAPGVGELLPSQDNSANDQNDENASRFGFSKRSNISKPQEDLLGLIRGGNAQDHFNPQAPRTTSASANAGISSMSWLQQQQLQQQQLTANNSGSADSILLAQLMNRKTNTETLPLNDPAIMSFARQQQQLQQRRQILLGMRDGSSSLHSALNPYENRAAVIDQTQVTGIRNGFYRTHSGQEQQQQASFNGFK